MSIKMQSNGKEFWLDFKGEVQVEVNNVFYAENENKLSIVISSDLDLDSSFNGEEFEVYLLAKKNVKENDIYQVYSREIGDRIGWIIPSISLGSSKHDYADNEHFLPYAYVAIKESLRMLDESVFSNAMDYACSEVNFSDIFHEETVLLIINKKKFTERYHFDIDRSSPSLLKYGYVKLSQRSPSDLKFESVSEVNKRIYIEQISSQINTHELISEIFNSSFAYEDKSVFKFFFLYQFVELLIDDVYKNEEESLIENLLDSMGDSGKTKEALGSMKDLMSEKSRIQKLVEDYIDLNDSLNELRVLCNQFLRLIGRDESNSFQVYFYTIRNFIFHQYRDFPKSANHLLEKIVQEFLSILPGMLYSYKYPGK